MEEVANISPFRMCLLSWETCFGLRSNSCLGDISFPAWIMKSLHPGAHLTAMEQGRYLDPILFHLRWNLSGTIYPETVGGFAKGLFLELILVLFTTPDAPASQNHPYFACRYYSETVARYPCYDTKVLHPTTLDYSCFSRTSRGMSATCETK
jgi:hypothetical protein